MANHTLKQVTADYDEWFKYSKAYKRKWSKFWKQWNNTRVRRQYFGTNDSFDPMTFQMVETAVDNVYGSRPRFSFIPTRVEQDSDTKILNGLLEYSWDKANMDLKIMAIGREGEITGNSLVFVGWADGCMTMDHVPIADCILDPAARDPEGMRYVGYRRLAMIADLKEEMRFDIEKGWVKRYTGLDELKTWGGEGDDKTDREQKEAYSGSTLSDDEKKGQIEVIYMAYKDQVFEIGNRKKIIAKYPSPFHLDPHPVDVQLHNDQGDKMFDESTLPPEFQQAALIGAVDEQALAQAVEPVQTAIDTPEIKAFLPFAMSRGFIDPALLLAKGNVEPFSEVQEDLNDILNEKKDNLAERVQSAYLYDKGQPELVGQMSRRKPGSLIPAEGIAQGRIPVHPLEKPQVANDADIEINRNKQSIRDTARIDQVVQGVSTGKNRTATEVNAQVAGASSGFNTKTRNLESGLYKQLGELFVKMVQIFLTDQQLVRVVGRDGVQFKQFDPNKYWGDYDVKVVLENQAKSKEREEVDRIMGAYKLFAGDPAFNQIELKKMVAQKVFDMDEDDLKLILSPNPNNQAVGPDGLPVGDSAAGAGPGLPPGLPPEAPQPEVPGA